MWLDTNYVLSGANRFTEGGLLNPRFMFFHLFSTKG